MPIKVAYSQACVQLAHCRCARAILIKRGIRNKNIIKFVEVLEMVGVLLPGFALRFDFEIIADKG